MVEKEKEKEEGEEKEEEAEEEEEVEEEEEEEQDEEQEEEEEGQLSHRRRSACRPGHMGGASRSRRNLLWLNIISLLALLPLIILITLPIFSLLLTILLPRPNRPILQIFNFLIYFIPNLFLLLKPERSKEQEGESNLRLQTTPTTKPQ